MSTEQEDAAMLLELQQKITTRIREQIYMVLNGYDNEPGTIPEVSLTAASLRGHMQSSILNAPHFITEITKKIGAKMANVF